MRKDNSNRQPKFTRRHWMIGAGALGAMSVAGCELQSKSKVAETPEVDWQQKAQDEVGPYLTVQDDFLEVTRSRPYLWSEEKRADAGLTRETWKLEIDSDPERPAKIGNPMTRELGTAFDFEALMALAKTKAVRFAKALCCLNNSKLLGTGIWEGVPLRDVLWLADPKSNLRRVFYYGNHNNDPSRAFKSSLPVGRVLEDAFDLPPVILCYKLNGEWLSSKRGGPVRMVVPEAYAFKSVKWLSNVVLTNLASANDSYANGNNDIDTLVKSFTQFIDVPPKVKANEPFLIKGFAHVGVSGVAKVQVWSHNSADGKTPLKGRFTDAPWVDAEILPAPNHWGSAISDGQVPSETIGFNPETNRPVKWPMRLAKLNWMYVHPGLVPGLHLIRCRSIDDNGQAQPMPRPFQKSGHAKIELQLVRSV